MKRGRFGGHLTAAFAVLVALILPGCATTVRLAPENSQSALPAKVQKSVAYFHDPDFRSFQQSADAYGNRHEFVFPIGAASHKLFESTYPRVFAEAVAVEAAPRETLPPGRFDAILRPKIEAFHFPLQNLKGPYWAELIYRFTLYTPEAKALHSWTVRGWGIAGDGNAYGEFGSIGEAVDKAMTDAEEKFIASFHNVPEIRRWTVGVPMTGATASSDEQRLGDIQEPERNVREGRYEGVVAVAAGIERPLIVPTPGEEQTPSGKLVGIRIRIANEGHRRLFIDPSDIVFTTSARAEITPMPGEAVAAAITPRHGRLHPIAPGFRISALTNLVIGLMNAAANSAEQKSLQANLERWRGKELQAAVLNAGSAVEGIAFFPLPAATGQSGNLKVPVIDLDTSTRYIVSIPLDDSP